MPSVRYLQSELNSKEDQQKLLNAKLTELRGARAIEAGAEQKFQLKVQIKKAEAEAAELDLEIQELETQLTNANLRLQIAGAANLGEWIFVTCDRGPQETDFRIHFSENASQRPGVPQVYIIQGDERQRHSSLVKRFHAVNVQEYVDQLPLVGKRKAAVAFWDIELPSQDDLREREKRLLFLLFDKCNAGYKYRNRNNDYSVAAFRKEIKASLHPAIVIQHDIKLRSWDVTGRELLQSYLRFLNEVQEDESTPQLIVFLNIIYPAKSDRQWRKILNLIKLIQISNSSQSYRLEIQKVFQLQPHATTALPMRPDPPCVLLKELSCVTHDDVMNWLRWNDIGGGMVDFDECCGGIIKPGECKSMAEIEGSLIKVLKRLREEREKTARMKGGF